ncbi:unnamed protein product [Cuscuta epithymum]|uniref:F-box associated beta-propeller type 1 domain-containing protein n=1 Tax=Cuscuta epithymum TaxID=186058 RepID=A0AAV0GLV1_9ASTE|nr:unnamed protein product [Cuscuta epithymum]
MGLCFSRLKNTHTSWSTKVLQFQGLRYDKHKVVGGLCYDPSMLDHKVVLLLFSRDRQFVIVSSLKSKVWREVSFPYNYCTSRGGVGFNNNLHWIVSDIKHEYLEWDNLAARNKIVYFDVVDDGFKIMPSPMPIHEEEEDSIVGTGIIDGCFCMARKDEKTQVIQVLLMKEYGKQESWVTAFVIPLLRFQPYADYNLEFLSQN